MNTLVLFCKTYRNDVKLLKRLYESIKKHNIDNIPFYISCPEDDMEIIQSELNGNDYQIINDEHILVKINIHALRSDWHNQQIVKSSFWGMGICENYVCIDSDSYFIRDFRLQDFMYDSITPYTIMHEQKELFNWALKYPAKLHQIKSGFENERRKIMGLFNRYGKVYDCGPSPTIWSCKVWETLHKEYLEPNKLTIKDLIDRVPSEFTWYGEWLLYRKPINIYPSEALFKVFHYSEQYNDFIGDGYTLDMLKENYIGIVLQSNWIR